MHLTSYHLLMLIVLFSTLFLLIKLVQSVFPMLFTPIHILILLVHIFTLVNPQLATIKFSVDAQELEVVWGPATSEFRIGQC